MLRAAFNASCTSFLAPAVSVSLAVPNSLSTDGTVVTQLASALTNV